VPTVGEVPVAAVPRYATPFNVKAMETAFDETCVRVKGDMIDPMFGVHTLPTVLLVHAPADPIPGRTSVKLKVMRPAAVLKVANPGMLVGPTTGGVTFWIVPPVRPANEPVFVPPTANGLEVLFPVRLKKRPELFTVTPPPDTFAILAVLPLIRGVAKAGATDIKALIADKPIKESPIRIFVNCTSSGIGVKVNKPPHGANLPAPPSGLNMRIDGFISKKLRRH
jgi:hypothetical protein